MKRCLDPEERNRFNMLLSGISDDVIVMLSNYLVEDVRKFKIIWLLFSKNNKVVGKPAEMIAALEGKYGIKGSIGNSELQFTAPITM